MRTNFNTREEFIQFLEDHDIIYEESSNDKYDGIYVVSKYEYNLKKKYPRKYKDLFIPYLRVSGFDEDMWYTRYCGDCRYMSKDRIAKICLKLEK